jgi:hypothetical protein
VSFSRPGSPVAAFEELVGCVWKLCSVVVTGWVMVRPLDEVIIATEVIVVNEIMKAAFVKLVEKPVPVTVVGTETVTVCAVAAMRNVIQDGTDMMISGLGPVAANETEDHAAMIQTRKDAGKHHEYEMGDNIEILFCKTQKRIDEMVMGALKSHHVIWTK